METIILTGRIREGRGKGACRQLRRNSSLPGVLYGGEKNLPISIDLRAFQNLLSSGLGENTIFQFNLEGEDKKERHVLMRELQVNPVTRALFHVDLYEVFMDKEIDVALPIVLVGEPVGVVQGEGMLHHALKELSLECLPASIPEYIEVDVSGLHIGDAIHVTDLKLDKSLKVLTDPEEVVVSITGLAREAVPTAEAPVEEPSSSEEQ